MNTHRQLIMFAQKRGYQIVKRYETDNNDTRIGRRKIWQRALLIHWTGCIRRAYYNDGKWRWA